MMLESKDNSISSCESDHFVIPQKKLPYPKSVFFIVSNAFCESFSYYGMRTILSMYLVDILLFSESDATLIYHTFNMIYFFPVFGAILSDSLLGKFRTILYASCIYALGSIALAMAATPPLHFPTREISILGLLLIAIGSGGIKPCVSPFGGDQFVIPQQELKLTTFFSLFYFSINSGSLVSTFISPIIREDVKCFSMESCYSLAFGIPGVLMIISIIVFGLGKPLYKIKKPEGNMLVRVSKCIGNAIRTKIKSKDVKKDSWLDYAEEEHGAKLVYDVKCLMHVLLLFLPLPVFWALFDQPGSGWTFMARRMNGDIGGFTLLPDQMQVVSPVFILVLIPLFQYVIYPLFNKCKILKTPLQRLVAGGSLAAISFIISAVICLSLESAAPIIPSSGNGQLRIYNALPCEITIRADELGNKDIIIPQLENYTNIDIDMTGTKSFEYTLTGCVSGEGRFNVHEMKSTAYLFNSSAQPSELEDDVDKTTNGDPKLRLLLKTTSSIDIKFINSDGEETLKLHSRNSSLVDLEPDEYTVKFGDNFSYDVELKLGGVYVFVGTEKDDGTFDLKVHTVTDPNSISILFLIPQYVLITMGEIMFAITGMEFAYSQAPTSMKSVLQACWMLTIAIGNLIVVIIQSAQPFKEQSKMFFLYAGLMFADMVVFTLLAMRYEYVKKEEVIDTKSVHKKNSLGNCPT